MGRVEIIGTEPDQKTVEYGDPKREVDEAVTRGLAVLGLGGREFSVVSVRGDGPDRVGHPEFLATVGGVLNGLGELNPPRVLTNITYMSDMTGEYTNAIITTQAVARPQ